METKPITPALTVEEWREWDKGESVDDGELSLRLRDGDFIVEITRVFKQSIPRLIAFANDALPDDSPQKITRADVAMLTGLADVIDAEFNWDSTELREFIGKLESLLKPVAS